MTHTHRPLRLAWGITGAGDQLMETVATMEKIKSMGCPVAVTTFLSKAAVFVLNIYRLRERVEAISHRVLVEKDANNPFIAGDLQTGQFDLLLVAPVTGNSVAKIVYGICDTLVTNAVAMANKTPLPVVMMPVEHKVGEIETVLPDGKKFKLFTRKLDADNTARLREMNGIHVIRMPKEIEPMICRMISNQ